MSHFTVLVIGDDPETQLAPYDENIVMEPYVKEAVSDEDKKSFMEFYLEKGAINEDVSFEDAYSQHGESWNSNEWKKNDAGIWEEWSTYNPASKWDWYQLGGRWAGFFKVKDGMPAVVGEKSFMVRDVRKGYADQLQKGAADFEYMRNEAGQRAAGEYDRLHAIVGGRDIPVWDEIREKHPGDIDAARKEYHDHPVIRDLNAVEEFREMFIWGDEPARFVESRADFIQKARNSAISTYAMIYKGEWYSKGHMGWFGFSDDKMTQDEWNKKFNELLDSLPDDTLLSVYDCHI